MDNDDELLDDLPDDMPGAKEMQLSWDLSQALLHLKRADAHNGRLWAIAATDAEKLWAWLVYAVGAANDPK